MKIEQFIDGSPWVLRGTRLSRIIRQNRGGFNRHTSFIYYLLHGTRPTDFTKKKKNYYETIHKEITTSRNVKNHH